MSINRNMSWLFGVLLLMAPQAWAQETPQNYDSNYANGNAPYSNAAPSQHRAISPFNPVGFVQNWTPFAPANISDYGLGPKPHTGFFFSYERVMWSISKPSLTDIGSAAAEGTFIEQDNDGDGNGDPVLELNTSDTSFLTAKLGWGNRWELGYMDNDDYGWLVSILDHVSQFQQFSYHNAQVLFNDPNNLLFGFYDANGDGIDDDLNSNFVFGRDGADTNVPRDGIPDLGAATDFGDQAQLFPRFGILSVRNTTTINGIEIMRMYRAPRLHNGGNFELLYGVRFMQVDDRFFLRGEARRDQTTQTIPNAPAPALVGNAGVLDTMTIDTTILNNIVGPQIGGRFSHQRGRWIFSVEGRFTAGANFQNGRQSAELGSHVDENPLRVPFPNTVIVTDPATGQQIITHPLILGTVPRSNEPSLNLVPRGTKNTIFNEEFSPVAELRINTAYEVTRSFALKFGYTALFADNIARASTAVNYTVPYVGFLPGDSNHNFLAHGLNFGVEFNR